MDLSLLNLLSDMDSIGELLNPYVHFTLRSCRLQTTCLHIFFLKHWLFLLAYST